MAITSTYPIIVPKATDLIVGTQTYTTADPVLDNPTRNFTVQSIIDLVPSGGGGGSGTVTSVSATGSDGVSVVGSPITTTGTLALSLTDGGVPITKLQSSAITINGTSVSLGGSITVGGAVTSLTTTGTSGVATLASGILNIPNYTTNTGTVTSVDLSTDIGAFIVAANPITSAGTITLNLNGGTAGQFLRQDGNWAAIPGGNVGTVTDVQTTNGAGISTSVANSTSAPNITITNTDLGSSQNIFKNFAVSGQTTIAADSNDDTLTLVAGSNITITTDAVTDAITIDAASVTNTFATDITVSGVLIGDGNTSAPGNTRVGELSLGQNTGSENTAIGTEVLRYNSTGSKNTGIGSRSMSSFVITGNDNTAVGYFSLEDISSGLSNTAIGSGSLKSITGDDFNVAVGKDSLSTLATGSRNVAVGGATGGAGNSVSNNSVFIGDRAIAGGNSQTNQIVIGATATGNGSNTVTLGNNSITDTYLKGNVNIPGDLEVTGNTIGVVGNNTDTYTPSAKITQIVTLSQAQYNAIAGGPLASTLYIIL